MHLSEQPPPPLPNFSVSSFTATFIDAKSSYQIAFNFAIRKPKSNPTKTIDYDNIVASLYYNNNHTGTTTLFPFKREEERNSEAVINAKFMVDPKIDIGLVGVLNVRVSAIFTLRDEGCFLGRELDVFCEYIWVESGSRVGPTKGCHVEKIQIALLPNKRMNMMRQHSMLMKLVRLG